MGETTEPSVILEKPLELLVEQLSQEQQQSN